jgi:hypothetical protein
MRSTETPFGIVTILEASTPNNSIVSCLTASATATIRLARRISSEWANRRGPRLIQLGAAPIRL